MKIGILCYPTYGGSGVVATELGMALAEKGHHIHFISYAPPFRLSSFSENICFHEVTVVDYPLFQHPPYTISLASKIADVAIQESLDIIHAHYAVPHAISASLANMIMIQNKRSPLPIITTLHGTDITIVGTDPTMVELVKLGLNQSTAITSVSKYLQDQTKKIFQPKKPIEVIYNFIDVDAFQKLDCIKYRRAFAKEHEKLIVHVSNFRKVKRVLDVVEVFYRVEKEIESRLIMVGDGPERPALEKLCRDLQICDKVKFLGKQSNVLPLLSIADVMVMPSLSESFGLAALEAMACETPVVATKAGGFPELIEHGKSGFLCEPKNVECMAERVIYLLKDEYTLKRFKDQALERAEEFDIVDAVQKYERVYEEAIQTVHFVNLYN